jgi:uncharacterized membrane protein
MDRKHLFRRLPIVLVAAPVFFIHDQSKPLTYEHDISPIITKHCLPCHAAENENPSGLALDNLETLKKGGEHGDAVVEGKPKESLLYLKLEKEPPFGQQMPRKRKPLTDEEKQKVYKWIEQGAKPAE